MGGIRKGQDDKMPDFSRRKKEIRKLKEVNRADSKDQKFIMKQHEALNKTRKNNKILKDKLKASNKQQKDDDESNSPVKSVVTSFSIMTSHDEDNVSLADLSDKMITA